MLSSEALLSTAAQAHFEGTRGRIAIIMAVSKIPVTLPSDLEAFIDARVASGRFATAGDVVREGLRLLEEREQGRDAVLAELRQEIEVGVAEAKAGQLRDGRTFFEALRQKVRSAS